MQALLGVLAALVGIAGHDSSCFTNPRAELIPYPSVSFKKPKCQFQERPPRRARLVGLMQKHEYHASLAFIGLLGFVIISSVLMLVLLL
jgi:hypothetical protein